MKKILIIGASILQLPAILKAKEMGFYVGVVDYNSKAVGVLHADEFFNVSTIDTEGILKVAKSFKPDGVMTMATDMPMRSIAAVTTELGLPGISLETALKATDKGEMIAAFHKHGVSAPWYFIVNNDDEFSKVKGKFVYPCIIKPIDSAGSRGVILVQEQKEVDDAYNYSKSHSRNNSVIIEEYMSGDEVSVEVMVVNKVIHILAITDKITTGPPHFVEMGHSQPSQLPASDQEDIKELTRQAVKALGIDNGPAHVEIMLTKDGPKMIEVGARMGGDNITSHLVPLSTGTDMVKATIELSMGLIPDLTPLFNKGSAIRYFHSPHIGTIRAINGLNKAKTITGVIELIVTKSIGDTLQSISNSNDRLGFIIAQAENSKMAKEICIQAIDEIEIINN